MQVNAISSICQREYPQLPSQLTWVPFSVKLKSCCVYITAYDCKCRKKTISILLQADIVNLHLKNKNEAVGKSDDVKALPGINSVLGMNKLCNKKPS